MARSSLPDCSAEGCLRSSGSRQRIARYRDEWATTTKFELGTRCWRMKEAGWELGRLRLVEPLQLSFCEIGIVYVGLMFWAERSPRSRAFYSKRGRKKPRLFYVEHSHSISMDNRFKLILLLPLPSHSSSINRRYHHPNLRTLPAIISLLLPLGHQQYYFSPTTTNPPSRHDPHYRPCWT